MNRCLTITAAAALLAAPVQAGVPSIHSGENAKWMRIDSSWTVDTEDIEVRGDQIRFWIRRNPTGNEEMSTQYKTAWIGKVRVRCGEFHA